MGGFGAVNNDRLDKISVVEYRTVVWVSDCGARVLDSDVVGAPRDVFISPLDHQDVLSLVFKLVADVVQAVTQMFH